jgi:hypothetical protein
VFCGNLFCGNLFCGNLFCGNQGNLNRNPAGAPYLLKSP